MKFAAPLALVAVALTFTTSSGGAAPSCAGAVPNRWKPWSTMLRGDVTGDGRPDTVFVGQRYPERSPCGRILFVRSGQRLLTLPLGSDSSWSVGDPAPIALANIDGTRGSEIVLRLGVGRVTEWVGVYTVRNSRIVQYRLPAGWPANDTFDVGALDAMASSPGGFNALDCVRPGSGQVVWSEASRAGVLKPGPRGFELTRTFLRTSGLRFVRVKTSRSHVRRLPFEFRTVTLRTTGAFGSCLVAHDWSAFLRWNPVQPQPG